MTDRERWQRIDAILDDVLDLEPTARGAHVAEACAGDEPLRREIEALLAAHGDAAAFMSTPAAEYAAPLVAALERERPSSDRLIGATVGRYRLVDKLGEGGMGVVYLAERIDGQVEQRVAVKLATQGLHGEEARRRFLRERQILARLEHPAIARLLDAGVTDEGTPFFVMERVAGRPVNEHCHAGSLSVVARLRLFVEICGAVQYAHRNLVVHRDLKPSNILVDDDGRVKLLDFGIAALLGDADPAAGTPQTIVRALTPDYAAPEQVRGEPVSISTDVYSLGVLLYELLTGERPYRITSGAITEIERAILDQMPAPPSARVGADLRRRLKGDLDRIVLKTLQKSPERRYQSAEALAADVGRHLDGLPVSAQSDALAYRARKFLGRHRVGAGAAALVIVTLVAGLISTTWQARRAEREARKAETVKEFMKTIIAAVDPMLTQGREPSVRQLLDAGAARIETELRNQPDVQSEVTKLIAGLYQTRSEYDLAVPLLETDLERRRRIDGPRSLPVAGVLTQLADARYDQGQYDEAGALYESALSIEREKRGGRTAQVAELLWDLGGVRRNRGDLEAAEQLDTEALALYVATNGDDSAEAAAVRESLAIVYNQHGRFADALKVEQPVLAWREAHLPLDHPHTLTARYNVAYYLQALGQFDAAFAAAQDVVARQRRVLGAKHDALAASLRVLARALDGSGRGEEARAPIAEALSIHLERFGADHLQVADDRSWHAVVDAHTGRLADAEQGAREALRIFDAQPGPPRADLPYVRAQLGMVLADCGRLEDAQGVVERAVSDLRARQQPGLFLGLTLDALGDLARQRGQAARALDLAHEALPLVERGLGADHPSTALARVHAGAAEWRTGHADRGEPLARAALAQLEQRFPNGHADLASALFIVGGALKDSGRTDDARPLLRKALDWRRAHLGASDPRTAAVRNALSSLQRT